MNRDVQWLFLIAGKLTAFVKQTRSISDEKRYLEKLFLWCSFRLSEKNEKDKKRKGLTPVSATPTHMLRICVNPSFNTFCRLAATGANKVPRPSNHSLTTATGSKRPRADSDSLLCHVRLWRASRFRFGCGTGCEHSEMRNFSNTFLLTPHPSRFACHLLPQEKAYQAHHYRLTTPFCAVPF